MMLGKRSFAFGMASLYFKVHVNLSGSTQLCTSVSSHQKCVQPPLQKEHTETRKISRHGSFIKPQELIKSHYLGYPERSFIDF